MDATSAPVQEHEPGAGRSVLLVIDPLYPGRRHGVAPHDRVALDG
ncbi:hypothetical protein [Isoptericola sp. NPDC057653]